MALTHFLMNHMTRLYSYIYILYCNKIIAVLIENRLYKVLKWMLWTHSEICMLYYLKKVFVISDEKYKTYIILMASTDQTTKNPWRVITRITYQVNTVNLFCTLLLFTLQVTYSDQYKQAGAGKTINNFWRTITRFTYQISTLPW